MEACPLLSWCKCSGNLPCLFCSALVIFFLTIAAAAIGYYLGRKKKRPPEGGKGQMSLGLMVELVFLVAIVWFLANHFLKQHFKSPVVNRDEIKLLNKQGINTTTSHSTIESYQEKLDAVQVEQANRLKEIEEMR